MKKRWGESGNIFFTLFGAVALVGVVGAATSTLMRGPVGTVVALNQRAKADSQMQIAMKLAMLEAQNTSNDCDGDSFIEPLGPIGPLPGLVGGGQLPNVGSTTNDPWGVAYGYCGWDHGTVTADACVTNGPLPVGNATGQGTVIAVISAGPDRTFGVTCVSGPVSPAPYITRGANGADDLIVSMTYSEANEASGGLWTIKSGNPDQITTNRELDVSQGAQFSSGNVSFSGSTITGSSVYDTGAEVDLSAGGLFMLPDETGLLAGDCASGADSGLLRRDTAGGTQEVLQICDGTAWLDIGGAGAVVAAVGNDGEIQFNLGGVGGVGGVMSADAGLRYASSGLTVSGDGNFGDDLNVTGDGGIGGAFSVTGNSVLTGTFDVDGAADFDSTINVAMDATFGSELLAGNGLVGSPTYSFSGDTDTGIYYSSGGLGFAIGGADEMVLSSGGLTVTDANVTGDLVVGDDLTTNDLFVNDTITADRFIGRMAGTSAALPGFETEPGTGMFSAVADTLSFAAGGSTRIVIDGTGDVGIGVGSPNAMLDVSGEIKVGTSAVACGVTLHGAIRYVSGDLLQVCSSVTNIWEDIGTSGGGGSGASDFWTRISVPDPRLYYTDAFVGVGTNNPLDDFHVNGDLLVTGSYTATPSVAVAGAGARMFFDPEGSAFRAGGVSGAQWDSANIGGYSAGIGLDVTASGLFSGAFGRDVTSSGSYAYAYGLGDATGVLPSVSGTSSYGIFMGDQSGVNLATNTTMALLGGRFLIDMTPAAAPAVSGTLSLDVEGGVGAVQYCDEAGTNCFTAASVATGGVGAPGTNREVVFNSNGVMGTDPNFTFNSAGNLTLGGTGAVKVPVGDGTNRPAVPTDGMMRYNTTAGRFEGYQAGSWRDLITGTAVAAGANNQIQFNSAGALSASADFTFNDTTNVFNVQGTSTFGALNSTDGTITVAGYVNIVPNSSGTSRFNITSDSPNGAQRIELYNTGASGVNWSVQSAGNNNAGSGGTGLTEGNFMISDDTAGAARMLIMKSTGFTALGAISAPPQAQLDIQGTDSVLLPRGTGLNRPASPVNGMLRYNTVSGKFEGYQAGAWQDILTSGVAGGAGAPNRGIQFNSGGNFAADANMIYSSGGTFLLSGTHTGVGDAAASGAGTRLFFDPTKSAFRAGAVAGTQWDNANVGTYSTGMGYSPTASGVHSTAIGYATIASGSASTAFGNLTVASGNDSTAIGSHVTAGNGTAGSGFGDGSLALGLIDDGVTITANSQVRGMQSMGIFMGDQDGLVMTANNTIGLFGGTMVIDPRVPAQQLSARATLDLGASTDAVLLPIGQVGNRPASPVNGMLRYNSVSAKFEGYQAGAWQDILTGSASAATPDRGIQFNSGGNFAANANFVFTSADRLGIGTNAPLAALDVRGNGIVTGNAAGAGSVGAFGLGDGVSYGIMSMTDVTTSRAWSTAHSQLYPNSYVVYYSNGLGVDLLAQTIRNDGRINFGSGGTVNGSLHVDVDGPLGATQYCDSSGLNCFLASSVANRAFAYGASGDIQFASAGQLWSTPNYNWNNGTSTLSITGNSTISGQLTLNSTGAVILPRGTTAQQPAGINGMLRYNSQTGKFEGYQGGAWQDILTTGVVGGASAPNRGIQFNSGGNFGASASFQFTSGGSFLTTGTYSGAGDATLPTGAGTRMFFDPTKAAFRVGHVTGALWDNANMGNYSVAWGYDTRASGISSFALGQLTTASGNNSTAIGASTVASGHYSTAIGSSVAAGNGTAASGFGDGSMALGLIDPASVTITTPSQVRGDMSLGIFMGDQDGLVMTANNTMGLFGGTMVIDPRVPAQQLTARATLDLGASTDAVLLPIGQVSNRPASPVNGMLRYNSVSGKFEGYQAGAWQDILTSGASTSIDALTDAISNTTSTVFLGTGSGTVSTGTGNTGVGINALASNVAKQENTAVGLDAMRYANSSAVAGVSYNTAMGAYALMGSTTAAANTGGANTAVGHRALRENTTGDNNAAFGSGAAVGNTTGNFNSVFGSNAMMSNTTGTNNTAVGYAALLDNVAKQESTALGYNAMRYADSSAIASVTYNTAVGSYAMRGSVTPAANTGTNNTALGHSALFTFTSGGRNTAVGGGALYYNTTGSQNSAFGETALFSNVAKNDSTAIGIAAMYYADNSAVTSSTYNTAVGGYALRGSTIAANNTGIYNTALGHSTLLGNTSGSNNTAVGGAALSSNTTGSRNTAVGERAMDQNVAKEESTAIGFEAMRYADSSAVSATSYNTAVGAYALRGSTTASANTGINNTAVGHNALMSVTSGSTNTATGAQAADSLTTGSGNTAFGYHSLQTATTSSNSTALGHRALQLSTGANNIAIGYQAGNNITSGATNLIIGYDIDAPSATASNQLNIGGLITGTMNAGLMEINGTGALTLPIGQTGTRPTGVDGMLRYNSQTGKFEGYQAGLWQDILTTGLAGGAAAPDRGIQFNSGGSFAADADLTWVVTPNLRQIKVGNPTTTPTSYTSFLFTNDLGANAYADFGMSASTFTAYPLFQNRAYVEAGPATSGLVLNVSPNEPIIMAVQGTELMRVRTPGTANSSVIFAGTSAITLPVGITGERPTSGVNGMLRYNSQTGKFEGYQAGVWTDIITTGATAAGSDTQVQINNNGVFYASAGLTYSSSSGALTVGDAVAANAMRLSGAAAGSSPTMTAVGTSANVGLDFATKGGGNFNFTANNYIHSQFLSSGDGWIRVGTGSRSGVWIAGSGGEWIMTGQTDGTFTLQRGNNVNSSPTVFSIQSNGDATFSGTGATQINSGATAERPASPVNGMLRYNSQTSKFEGYQGGNWTDIITAGGTAASPDRGIQFNSGGNFAADSNLIYSSSGALVVSGTYTGAGTEPVTGGGTRLFFDPRKSAFRAGSVTGGQWNYTSVGSYSTAMGYDTVASGTYSTAMGWNTTAGGQSSTAMGIWSTASGQSSTAMGSGSNASGIFSTAMGRDVVAGNGVAGSGFGDGSIAMGLVDDATGIAVPSQVRGIQSFGIFMGDQDGLIQTGNNTMALFGGKMVIDSAVPATYMAAPTYNLSFSGDTAAQTIGVERETTAATAGRNITMNAGGAVSGGTNLAGGNLVLQSGIATGNGASNLQFQTVMANQGTGTTDRAPATAMTLASNALTLPVVALSAQEPGQAGMQAATNGMIYYNSTTGKFRGYQAGQWADIITGSAISTFLSLTDTPSSYAGEASKYVRVNAGATALEFTDQIVSSVTGQPAPTSTILDDLGDVVISTPSAGQILTYSGGNWVNGVAGGGAAATPDRGIQFNSGNSFAAISTFTYTSAGRMGVGTAAPVTRADFAGSIKIADGGESCNATYSGAIRYTSVGTLQFCNGTAWTSTAAGVGLVAIDDLTDARTVYSSSNMYLGQASGNPAATGDSNTALGINALANGTTGYHNTAIGTDAMQFNTTGNYNTAVGSIALGSITTGAFNTATGYAALAATSNSLFNTAHGYRALRATTSGASNTAMGYFALDANTIGAGNIAIGMEAGSTNVAGSEMVAIGTEAMKFANSNGAGFTTYNTAVGAYALRGSTTAANNTGVSNTAIGHSALLNTTSGGNNAATGYNALAALTTGSYNAAFGSGALFNVTTDSHSTGIGYTAGVFAAGTGNTALGSLALSSTWMGSMGTGAYNVALGESAMAKSTATDYNVSIGSRSLYELTTGDNNIAIGWQAGDNITTGSSNITIGHDINAASATASNQLNIGNLITGAMDQGLMEINGTGALTLPIGQTGNRPAGVNGMIRYNSQTSKFEGYQGGTWTDIITAGGTAASPDRGIQFNSGGSFAASSNMTYTSQGALVLTGTYTGTGTEPVSGAGTRMFFDPRKAAFRAGAVSAAQWNYTSTGNYSAAMGSNTVASGDYSTALGSGSTASGSVSTALGSGTTASGLRSTAMGWGTVSSGLASTAMGEFTTASGDYSTAMGDGPWASGYVSTAMGSNTIASGSHSTAMGKKVTAGNGVEGSGFGDGSMAIGLIDFTTAITTASQVRGDMSLGIFMGDQDGLVMTANNTMGLFGGTMVVDPRVPAQQLTARATLDLGASTDAVLLPIGQVGNRPASPVNGMLRYNSVSGKFEGYQAGAWQDILTTGASTSIDALTDAVANYTSANMYFGTGVGALSTGINNTAMGVGALAASTTGQNNVAVGWEALSSNTTGSTNIWAGNVAVGSQALKSATIAELNTAVGNRALTLATGSHNTAIGGNALSGVTTGGSNVAIGNDAGTTITTGANNIAIGMGVTVPLATGSDQLNIGNMITGTMDQGLMEINGTGALTLPIGQTGNRPAGVNGMIRYNSQTSKFEGYQAGVWTNMIGSTLGAFTSLTDVPNSYTGSTLKYVRVNSGETGLEFTDQIMPSVSGQPAPSYISTSDLSTTVGTGAVVVPVGTTAQRPGTALAGMIRYNSQIGKFEGYQAGAWGDIITSGGLTSIDSLTDAATSYDTTFNLFMGQNAGAAILAGGTYNLILGEDAGDAITTGDDNVGVGYGVLGSVTTAVGNSAFGKNALAVVTANDNAAFGNSALAATTTGPENTAFGSGALQFNQTGQHNVAVGRNALVTATAGNDNVAVGMDALRNNTGSNNIAIGYAAGDAVGSGSNNIIIGYNIDFINTNGTNQLNIGDTIHGDLANDRIRIGGTGAVSAFSDLELAGTLALKVSSGTTAQRPATPANGMIRYNSQTSKFEGYQAGAWTDMIGGGASAASPDRGVQFNSGGSFAAVSTFTYTSAGRLGVANSAPDATVEVTGGLCVSDASGDDCTTPAGKIKSDGSITANAFDLAERYPSDTALEPGTIVALDGVKSLFVHEAQPDATGVVGIVSSDPGLVLGWEDNDIFNNAPHVTLVALSGRVPLKVTGEGGAINIGDRIALSATTAGHGTKASDATGAIVGIALESFAATDVMAKGQITVFVQTRDMIIEKDLRGKIASLEEKNAKMDVAMNDIVNDINGLKAHTGYGINKAGFSLGILAGMALMFTFAGLFFFVMQRRKTL